MRRSLVLLMALALTVLANALTALAQGPDDQYVQIYNLIREADGLKSEGQPNQALAKYLEAQTALQRFQKGYPDWNASIVKFRLKYLDEQVSGLSEKSPRTSPPPQTPAATEPRPAPGTVPAANPSAPPATDDQLNALKESVRQLQADKTILEAKLKEALAAQPAAFDPRELTKAEARIQALQKENDLLKVSLRQAKSQAPPAVPAPKPAPPPAPTSTSKADAEAIAALRAENLLLKKQLAQVKTPTPAPPPKSQESPPQLAQAQAQIATLQTEKESLRLEKEALENRLKQLTQNPAATNAAPPPVQASFEVSPRETKSRVKQLEHERDDLQKKLSAALKDAYGSKNPPSKSPAKKGSNDPQLAALRARLDVLEAKPVPYAPEELALMKVPQPKLAQADPKAGKKSIKQMPPGSASLVAEAQRYFAEKRLDKAADKYREILRLDDKNAYTLANLAAIEIERGHLTEADGHIQQALRYASDDAYTLSILGYLRFRQEKYDDALDALSRAAQAEPENPEIQNYLGLTLSQKGLRGPAETALRKAIQIDPAYGNAHNNLAVIYLTQKPPMVELARWHYQKALASGHPRNPELEKMLDANKLAEGKQ